MFSLIVSTTAYFSIKFKLTDRCESYATTLACLKLYDAVQRPRVSRYGLKTFLCIFWNSCGVLHDRLLEMSLRVSPYVNYHKLGIYENGLTEVNIQMKFKA